MTWGRERSGTENHLEAVFFTDSLTGTVVGDEIILHTNDGGTT